jgi:hypothetical protein
LADRWLVDDVSGLQNEQIQAAIDAFDEKHPPAPASARRPSEANADYEGAESRVLHGSLLLRT